MATTDMPDAITNPITPRDQHNSSIADGNWYRLYEHNAKPVTMLVRSDPDEDILLCQKLGDSQWQRVDSMSPNIRWELLEGDEVPC